MSQVNATDPLAAPAAPAAAPPAPSPAATPPAPQGNYVQVPREQLANYDHSWHKVMEAANAFGELGDYADLATELKAAGYSEADTRRMIVNAISGQQGQDPATPQPTGLTQADLDKAIGKLQQSFTGALEDHDRSRQQQQLEAQSRQAESEFIDKAVTNLGFTLKGDDGADDPVGGMIRREVENRLLEVMREQMPEDLDEQQRREYINAPATQAQLDEAMNRSAPLKDIKFTMAAAVASEQQRTPAAPLGEAPGGPGQGPAFEDMSPEEQTDAIMDGVALPGSDE